MSKKLITTIVIITSILLVSLYVLSNTYSVIIDVIEGDNGTEIINKITIRDLLIDDNGNYNSTYYEVLNELVINDNEANTLMESVPLNRALQVVLNDIANYKLHNSTRMTKREIYDLIVASVNEDDNIDENLKNKIIKKSNEYLNDVYNYLYDIKVNSNGEQIWYI